MVDDQYILDGDDQLVFAHQERTSIGRCIEDLELMAQCCSREEVANQVIFIPLR
jgi:hypothetical protein